MSEKVLGIIKLQVAAGKANPAPPIGPALGQRGLNIMDFCKAFNEATKEIPVGTPIPVVISVHEGRKFSFITRKPPVSYYIKQATKLAKGSQEPGKKVAGKITRAQIAEIARQKMVDMNANDLEAACSMIAGSAVSMGITVVEGNE